ncbi:MAG: endonuclease/exonuclease/phosphatase [Bacteroidetes bacterium]|nr:endonuclease/exonuclease/phosphatase [Bacteroidota bacterium]
MQKHLLVLAISITCLSLNAQKKQYKSAIIGFYNLENLFDTTDNTSINDEEFLPSGIRNYNTAIYRDKLTKLAAVIAQIGTAHTPDGPALLGIAEIENDTVLNDLVKEPLIQKRNYQYVHYDSKDARGVDVGLLYNPSYFSVLSSDKLFVSLPAGSKDAYYTRDILWVKGKLIAETIHVYVNHWPSRSGGEKRSEPGRIAAATVCRKHIDSILLKEPEAKIIVMGDLNDDPINKSVEKVLRAVDKDQLHQQGTLFNPWLDLYKKGFGTLAYQDAWGLFDQIIVSKSWLDKEQNGFFLYQPQIFNEEFLVENKGPYKGYPMRTWDGNSYRGGYSDHFPTYLLIIKQLGK